MRNGSINRLLVGLLVLVAFADRALGQVKELPPKKEVLIINADGFGMPDAALSRDGRFIVTGQYAGFGPSEVLLFDANTGEQLLTTPNAHSERYTLAVGFSPDGNRIASGGDDALVKVWDARTGKPLLTLKGHTDWVRSVAWSPDGKRIISGCGFPRAEDGPKGSVSISRGEAKVWDAETGKELLTLSNEGKPVKQVAISPDGKRIATSGLDWMVKVWDAETGKELLTYKGNPGSAGIAFSPDGKRIVSVSGNNIKWNPKPLDYSWIVKVWEVETGKEQLTIEGPNGKGELLRCAAFSPDGKSIVAGGSVWAEIPNVMSGYLGLVKVWDAATGREIVTYDPASRHITSSYAVNVAFTPDGNRLVAGCRGSTVHVWALERQNRER